MVPRRLARSAVVVLVIFLFAFASREFAVLAAIGGGLAGVGYLATRTPEVPAQPADEGRSKRERFLRDNPPPPIA